MRTDVLSHLVPVTWIPARRQPVADNSSEIANLPSTCSGRHSAYEAGRDPHIRDAEMIDAGSPRRSCRQVDARGTALTGKFCPDRVLTGSASPTVRFKTLHEPQMAAPARLRSCARSDHAHGDHSRFMPRPRGGHAHAGSRIGTKIWLTDEQMVRLEPYFPKSHEKSRVHLADLPLVSIRAVLLNIVTWRSIPWIASHDTHSVSRNGLPIMEPE
jgi:hypothetical protein